MKILKRKKKLKTFFALLLCSYFVYIDIFVCHTRIILRRITQLARAVFGLIIC